MLRSDTLTLYYLADFILPGLSCRAYCHFAGSESSFVYIKEWLIRRILSIPWLRCIFYAFETFPEKDSGAMNVLSCRPPGGKQRIRGADLPKGLRFADKKQQEYQAGGFLI